MDGIFPPAGAERLAAFAVRGMPRPAGSKNAIPLGRRVNGRFIPVTRKDGTPIFNLVDSSGENGANWRTDIRAAASGALDAAHELADGPLAVRATFFYAGPKGRYGTGRNAERLKDSADRYPHQGELADGTKLARALEDALNSLAWVDDRRVCDLWWSRRFDQAFTGARVDIFTLPAKVAVDAGEGQQILAVVEDDKSGIIPGDGNDDHIAAVAG